MTKKKSAAADPAVEQELEGVPEHMKDDTPEATDAADAQISALEEALAAAQQDVLYAQAETQNVRRRMEKEAQDARAYAATGFARDVLSVSDNLSRALEAIHCRRNAGGVYDQGPLAAPCFGWGGKGGGLSPPTSEILGPDPRPGVA
jgi:molecular chaperone GrpE (heat shock protein)